MELNQPKSGITLIENMFKLYQFCKPLIMMAKCIHISLSHETFNIDFLTRYI